ncbi:endonuclease/exonuclease/phosphatase family protein [Crocosphaera sp. XPORK-15E]|uniref:endonuclease/exonuclease/phosphatase family protein n=1 Tax=Crocosphaera sp. XPORK-15E TaxID=3110247 RepID=UPI002B203678|nr:endonuclease/exonuclease/phosphatase family protein [Crocosphaera sp. XPORK-15E]MEA5536321.1 endonuclease/exonuclease/phosphatase family protein [Crocosphaera sp. XPORK-15E]
MNTETTISYKTRQKSFNVGTFNLYNLVLPQVKYHGNREYTPEVYQQKKAWINHQLNLMKADIIGFQELFHQEALQEIIAENQDYKDAAIITTNPTGELPTVALLSKFPVIKYTIFKEFPLGINLDFKEVIIPINSFSRPVIAADIALTDDIQCTVFVVHLKSKRPIIPESVDRQDPVEFVKGKARALILRAAEAAALRVILMDKLKNRQYPVIVLGDLNDGNLAVTTRMIMGEPPWEKLRFEAKKKIWDVLLYSVKDIQARQSYGDFYFSHIHNGYYESLDHILVSEEFVAFNRESIGKVTYVSVFNDHLIDEMLSDAEVEPWQSDHGQVVASFQLKPPLNPS